MQTRPPHPMLRNYGHGLGLLLFVVLCLVLPAHAQDNTPAQDATPIANADGKVVETPETPKTPQQLTAQAWQLLTEAVTDPKHIDIRIQALGALGTMGSNPRAGQLILHALDDREVDVRTAAVLAAAQTRSHRMVPALRRMLDDHEPQVVFTAASSLWKMGDREAGDLLIAVVDGERRANATLVNSTMHSMNREMHDPAAIAKFGAMQGASMLLGPFGYGLTAYEYISKNGGDSARVLAITEIAQQHTPAVRKTLLGALTDKDVAVRAEAAKAVRTWHDAEVAMALASLFVDPKRPVQFAAAAGYLIATGTVATPPPTPLQP